MWSMAGKVVEGAHLSMTSEFVRMWLPGRLPIVKLLSRSAGEQDVGCFH